MRTGRRGGLAALLVGAALAVGVHARTSSDAELQFQLGTLLFADARFDEAAGAFRRALTTDDSALALRARIGLVRSALRIGDFDTAQKEGASLRDTAPNDPEAMATHADAMWSAGLFDEAEQGWRDALSLAPDLSRGRQGLARALASEGRLDEALDEALAAERLAPNDGDIYHTVGAIYERLRRYPDAARAYTRYVELLPNKARSAKAAWSRAQVHFLESFEDREPLAASPEILARVHTVDFELEDDKVIVKARVNGGRWQDFVLDTGSEQTTISRQTASSRRVKPVTYTLSAGVGEVGLRGLQLGRMDTFEVGTLKLENVPVLIKAPALRDLPRRETESFSPLALGFSMTIDYQTRKLSLARHLPDAPADYRLPMRQHRLAMVRGMVNGVRPAYFVVDTGGEVISISAAMAETAAPPPPRKIALKVYGSSGWDRDAFLLPGVDLAFNDIAFRNFSVVVLNLRAPSVLLGFQVGGIIGHAFLGSYRASLDIERSELRLSRPGGAAVTTSGS